MNLTRDISYMTNGRRSNATVQLNPSLECDGLNVSTTHGIARIGNTDYDHAVRFPLIDIITFWPNRTSKSKVAWASDWWEDVHVEVVCLRPDTIAKDSRVPPSAGELMTAEGARFPTSGAVAWTRGSLGWLSMAILGFMLEM
jgi:hypothetical protein